MKFDNPEGIVTDATIAAIESDIKLDLPKELRTQYLSSNGGVPSPYVYEDDNLDTVITAFLPISSPSGKRTAVDIYKHLVLAKGIVPQQYFPFAVDGGGDYFFVDCSSTNGDVSFYRSDPPTGEEPLVSLGVKVGEFWSRLKPE